MPAISYKVFVGHKGLGIAAREDVRLRLNFKNNGFSELLVPMTVGIKGLHEIDG
jgi:hypothetical protein